MKKNKLLIVLLALFVCSVSQAQTPLDDDGYQFSLSSGYTTKGIPINIGYEMGVHEYFTFGIQTSFRFYNEDTDSVTYKHNIVGLNFIGNYYFNKLLKLDEDKWGVYGGLNLGFYKWFSPKESVDVKTGTGTLAAGIQIGGRYYMKNYGIFLEIQAGSENIGGALGVSYRFGY